MMKTLFLSIVCAAAAGVCVALVMNMLNVNSPIGGGIGGAVGGVVGGIVGAMSSSDQHNEDKS